MPDPGGENRLMFVSCNNCGKDDYRVLFESTLDASDEQSSKSVWQYTGTTNEYGKFHRTVKCNHCGLIYENPRDSDDHILKNYNEVVDPDYLATKEERQGLFRELLKEIERFSPKGVLLDIGCYAGFFLEVAKSKGWEVFGVEPSHWAADHARAEGLNVVSSTLGPALFAREKFDVITLWDVIEHLLDPKGTLREINRIMKPAGILALSTHNLDSLMARILGKRYPFIMRMHLYHFTPDLLKQMLAEAGFEILMIRSNGRRFRLSYLTKRFGMPRQIKNLLDNIIKRMHLDDIKLSINLNDTFRLYARKIKNI